MATAANPSHAMASVLVDELVRCGLRHVCVAPGSRSAALAMAFAEREEVATHVGIDERSVSFLALGIARVSHVPVAVLTTSGTAAANLHPAVVEADLARAPLLVLTADRPPELRHTAANQTIDQVKLYGDAVRFFAELGVAEDREGAVAYWRSLTCRAWASAAGVGNPPGPVHLNLPFREPLVPLEVDARGTTQGAFTQPTSGRPSGRPWTEVVPAIRRLSDARLSELASRIDGTERGLVVVGETNASPETIATFAEHIGWPLIAEPLSGARRGANAIVGAHALLSLSGFADRHRPDLVVRIGRVGLSRALLRHLPADVDQILLDPDAAWLDPERALSQIVAAAVDDVLPRLLGAVASRPVSAWLGSWRQADGAARAVVDAVLDAEDRPTEPRVARDVAGAVPDGGALVVGSSMPVRDLDQFMAPHVGLRRVIGNRGASGIDGFVSTALGVALAHDGPVLALCGDLSLLHDTNGLATVPADDVDLVVVVVNNDGGGIFSLLPQAEFAATFERLFGTPHGTDLAALVGAHGWGHRLVAAAADLVDALDEARATGGRQVVEVRTHRGENAALHRRILAEVATALGHRDEG